MLPTALPFVSLTGETMFSPISPVAPFLPQRPDSSVSYLPIITRTSYTFGALTPRGATNETHAVPISVPTTWNMLVVGVVTCLLKVTAKSTNSSFPVTFEPSFGRIETTLGAIVYVGFRLVGTNPSPFPKLSTIPVPFAKRRPTVPVAVPGLTVTVQTAPDPVTLLIAAFPKFVPVTTKFEAVNPVTLLLKVMVKPRLVAALGVEPARTTLFTAIGSSLPSLKLSGVVTPLAVAATKNSPRIELACR